MQVVNILGTIALVLLWGVSEKSIQEELVAVFGLTERSARYLSYLIASLVGIWWGLMMLCLKAWVSAPEFFAV